MSVAGNFDWQWVGASATGTRHLNSQEYCQDHATAFEVKCSEEETTFVAIVSDGAGSTKLGGIGSAITCNVLARCVRNHLRGGNSISCVSDEIVLEWVEQARSQISTAAENRNSEVREFAATLVMAIIGTEHACFIQIGDGACVFNTHDDQTFKIPIWPMQGEYASTTYFITDQNGVHLKRVPITASIKQLAVFTDGIEKLALVPKDTCADDKFLDALFQPFSDFENNGRNKKFSKLLRDWLDSKQICEKTDDDKTLILAVRDKRHIRTAVSGVDDKSSESEQEN